MDLRSRRWRVATAGLALAVGAVTFAPASAADPEQELDETRRRAGEARSRLGELERSDVELAAAIEAATGELDTALADLRAAEADLRRAETRLAHGREELAAAGRRVTRAEDELRRRAARAFAQPRLLPDSAIIESGDPLELAKRAALADAVLDGDSDAVADLRVARAERADLVAELETVANDAAIARAAADEQRAQVEAHKEELEAARAELQRRLDETAAEVEALQQEEQELVEVIRRREEEARRAAEAEAAEAAAAGEPDAQAVSAPGRLLWPADGWVSSEFGPRWGRNHNGIDIAAPTGTTVRAAADGVVYHAGAFGTFGNLVAIDHGGGMTTLYAHLATVEVAVGQWVNAGTRVAGVGSTGRSTGPHLHFEVRVGGVASDPRGFLG